MTDPATIGAIVATAASLNRLVSTMSQDGDITDSELARVVAAAKTSDAAYDNYAKNIRNATDAIESDAVSQVIELAEKFKAG